MTVKKQITIDAELYEKMKVFCSNNYFTLSAFLSCAAVEYINRHEFDKEKAAYQAMRMAFSAKNGV